LEANAYSFSLKLLVSSQMFAISAVRQLGKRLKPATLYIEVAEKMHITFALQALNPPINEAEYLRAFDAMQRDHVDGGHDLWGVRKLLLSCPAGPTDVFG
jgi:hypothetical protein